MDGLRGKFKAVSAMMGLQVRPIERGGRLLAAAGLGWREQAGEGLVARYCERRALLASL